ncbi:chloride channel protein [Lacticaseibacillus kribbianus]|uniref:chloride channel protein n=1 Tax=Lacticaseibacillus kribbianus TaxID=2926292 RepID=UPI001CD6C041|nr:chloride channel protein [Lacticaseibacillus kribbianus]
MDKRRENLVLAAATLVLGVAAGLGAVLLSVFLDVIEQLFLHFQESAAHPFATGLAPWQQVLALLGGGVAAAVIWYLLRRFARPTVGIASAIKGTEMPLLTTLVHDFTQILYVGAGGSVGRELAPRELAAAVAQRLQRVLARHGLRFSEPDRQLLVAAAAGAGFAGVYIAPLTGTMFAVEILLHKVSRRTVVVSFTMSVIAMLVGSLLKGFKPYYLVGQAPFAPKIVLAVLVLAPVCGALGGWFRRAFKWAGARATKDRNILWQLPLVALATGVVAVKFPQIMGNGRALAQTAMHGDAARLIPLLLVGAALKAVVTVATLRAGASGGTLTPSIAIGASLGAVLALLLGPVVGPVWQLAIIGAAALLAASQQAPFMAMFMLIEVSHLDYSAILPLGLAVSLAMVGARLTMGPTPEASSLSRQR